jgi:hypothetical protein
MIVLAVLAVAFTAAPAAHANPDALMAGIASHQQMGWKDNKTPMPVLERRIAEGGRVYASCSVVAELGYRTAIRHGIPARHVSAITNARFDGYNDGHAMIELGLGGHWVLYDLDLNRRAVDSHGRGVGLAYQVSAGNARRWQVIAHDADHWNFAGTGAKTRRMVAPFAHMSAERWYRHTLGVALVETSPGQYAYHGNGHRSARIDSVWAGHYRWVNAAAWRTLSR